MLTPKEITKLKSKLRREVDDDGDLFEAGWRKVRWYARNAEIYNYSHLRDLYDSFVSEMVNNMRSPYYIFGHRRF